MAELRRAQQAKRNRLRGGVIGLIVIIVIVLALVTSGAFSSGSSSTKVTITPAVKTALPASVRAALVVRKPPKQSPDCTTPAAASTAPTTTTPASGNAVSIIPAPASVPFPKLDGSAPHYTKFSTPPPFCLSSQTTYTAVVTTDVGTVTILLLPQYAPVTVNNFVFLAGYHYFDGTVFHRVMTGFVDQGGDPTGTGQGGPGYKFADELPTSKAAYDPDSVAMANSGPGTNGSQFFWVVGNGGQQLQPNYSMFGQIVGGADVVSKINADGSSTGTPTVLHHIVSVTIEQSPASAPLSAVTSTTAPASTTTAPATTAPPSTSSSSTTTSSTTTSPSTTSESTTTSTTSRSSSTSTTR